MSNNTLFVLVDDERTNNIISIAAIKKIAKQPSIKDFVDPEAGVDYLKHIQPEENTSVVLLLDINMPVMNGWDVLNEVERLDAQVKKKIRVFMLSSSSLQNDKARARNYSFVIDYIEKPLSIEKFEAMHSKLKLLELN